MFPSIMNMLVSIDCHSKNVNVIQHWNIYHNFPLTNLKFKHRKSTTHHKCKPINLIVYDPLKMQMPLNLITTARVYDTL